MAVACATNFAIVSAPCHGFADATLPSIPVSEDLLLAALLPEREDALLDAGGMPAPRETSPFSWPPARTAGSRPSPVPLPAEAGTLETAWVQSSPQDEPAAAAPAAPWQPGDVPATPDPAPPAGVFGQLPIEQQAGNCVITGEVSDSTTLDPIPGAIVDIIGTGRTAETDAQGKFRIDGLPEGNFTAEASALNYTPATLGASPVASGPVQLRFSLRQKPADSGSEEYVLEEESIVGEYSESSQGDFELTLDVAPNIGSGLSKDELTKTGVSDAAGAVSKIAGANIVGGKYAVVRGLGDRYSNTLFNGSLISSADPSRKAVQLDLFPAHLLQNVTIYKTYTPNYTAEWAGGLVLLETLRFPEEQILEFEVTYGMDSAVHDADAFYAIPGSELGFSGQGNPGWITNEFGLKSANLADNAARKRYYESLNSSRDVRPYRTDAEDSIGFDVTLGDSIALGPDSKLGFVIAFTRDQKDEVKLDQIKGRGYDPVSNVLRSIQEVDEYERSVNWGLLASANLKVGERHEIGTTYFRYHDAVDSVEQMRYGRSGGEEPRLISSNPRTPDDQPYFGDAAFVYDAYDQLDPLRRDLEVAQVRGLHRFGEDPMRGPRMEWNFASSSSSELRPHTSQINFDQLDFSDPALKDLTYPGTRTITLPGGVVIEIPDPSIRIPEKYNPARGQQLTVADLGQEGIAGTIIHLTRESLSTEEQMRNGNLDFILPKYFDKEGDDRFELSLGGSFLRRERQVRGELFYLLARNEAVNFPDFIDRDDGGFGIGAGDYIGSGGQYQDGSDIFDGLIDGPNNLYYRRATISRDTRRNVDASTEIDAAYLMGSLYVGTWELSAGGRFETETRGYEILGPGSLNFVGPNEELTGSQTNDYFLPAFRLRRDFGEEKNITVEAAWSRTVGRPTFYEFAPIQTEDQGTGDSRAGNPDLTDSLIDNFDLAFRYRNPAGTTLGVSLFHKKIDSPIIKAFELSLSEAGADVLTFRNANDGTLNGVEFEISQPLADRWNLTANYTYIDSLLNADLLAEGGGTESVGIGFEGQPEHIFNAILGYNHEKYGISANLIYNFTGEYLQVVPRSALDDKIIQESRATLDLVVKKQLKLFGCDGTVTFKAGNLLEADVRSSYETSGFIYEQYSPGRTFSIAYKTEF